MGVFRGTKEAWPPTKNFLGSDPQNLKKLKENGKIEENNGEMLPLEFEKKEGEQEQEYSPDYTILYII